MDYVITLVTLQPVKLYTMSATNQPHNVKVGWPVFKRMLGHLQGRSFYGLQTELRGSGTYRFGSTLLAEDTFDQFEIIHSPSGLFACVQLVGKERNEHINLAFDALIEVYDTTIDSSRPFLERYGENSVDVLVPLKAQQRND